MSQPVIPLTPLGGAAAQSTQPVATAVVQPTTSHQIQGQPPQLQQPQQVHQGQQLHATQQNAQVFPKKISFKRHIVPLVNGAFAVAAIVVAVYYGWWSLKYQRWSAENDFRGSCKDAKADNVTSAQCEAILASSPEPPPSIYRPARRSLRRQFSEVMSPKCYFWLMDIAILVALSTSTHLALRMLNTTSEYGYVYLDDERPSPWTRYLPTRHSCMRLVNRCVNTCIFAFAFISCPWITFLSACNSVSGVGYLFPSLAPNTFSYRSLTILILVAGPLIPALVFAIRRDRLRKRPKADFHSCEPGYRTRTNKLGQRVVTADDTAVSSFGSQLQSLRRRGK